MISVVVTVVILNPLYLGNHHAMLKTVPRACPCCLTESGMMNLDEFGADRIAMLEIPSREVTKLRL